MSINKLKISFFLVIGVIFILLLAGENTAWSQSLIEYYNSADKETLEQDTQKITKKLKTMFNPNDIAQNQAKIDFSDFFSNFKNLILYATKLANYHDYQENIKFGREREIYQVLSLKGEMETEKRSAINKKYDRLEEISQDEIETYKDMIETAFDTCELYTETTLFKKPIFKEETFKQTMEEYLAGPEFQEYCQKKALLEQNYPEYVDRISHLVLLWKGAPPAPTDPIINPEIVNAL